MHLTPLLPLLTPLALAAPIPNPTANPGSPGIALLGMCIAGGKHCHNGPGLFSSLFGGGAGAGASDPTSTGRGSSGIMVRAEESIQSEQLGVASLLGSLPIVSSLFGTGSQGEGVGGGSGGGGLGLKERGEEAGIGDLLSGIPLLGGLLGGGKPKNSQPTTASASAMGMGMSGSGRAQHPGGSIGI